jgi:hypothetical protein
MLPYRSPEANIGIQGTKEANDLDDIDDMHDPKAPIDGTPQWKLAEAGNSFPPALSLL